MESEKRHEEHLVKDIITRYGEVIDLRKNPFVIVEIIRNFSGGIAAVPDAGVSVAGVGSPPGPGPAGQIGALGNVVDNAAIMKEVLKLSRQVNELAEHVQKLGRH
jgi:hypothetical protein